MPTWTRLVVVGLLALIAVISLLPLAYAGLRLLDVGSGGATRYGVRLERESGEPATKAEVDAAVAVLRARLERLGVTSPIVEPSSAPGENIEVVVPPFEDPEYEAHVKELLKAEAVLELQPVVGDANTNVYRSPAAAEESPGFDPDEHEVLPYLDRDESAADHYLVVEKRPVVVGADMRDVTAAPDQFKGANYQIEFTLEQAAAEKFGAWTEANVGKYLAIVLNDKVRSAPRIQSRIGDRGQITGSFSRRQAQDLAVVLGAGRLPGAVTLTSEAAVASNHWRVRYGAIAAVFALVLVASVAGAVAIVWSLLRRKSAAS